MTADTFPSPYAPGPGFIALTAHNGSWKSGSRVPSTQCGRSVQMDPRAHAFIKTMIEENALDTVAPISMPRIEGAPSLPER